MIKALCRVSIEQRQDPVGESTPAEKKQVSQHSLQQTKPSSGLENTQQTKRTKKLGRNDPCPCGSGKKYKYCHG